MSIDLTNPPTALGKVDAAWNYLEQTRLALMMGDKAHAEKALNEAVRLLSTAVEQLQESEQ